MANYELAADYYKGEESNRYALSYEFMSMLVSKELLQCFDTVGWMRGMASGLLKNLAPATPKVLWKTYGIPGLTWSNLLKIGRLNKNQK